MAKAEIKVGVSVEKLLHNALGTALEEIFDKHDVKISKVSATWYTDVSGKQRVASLEVTTMTWAKDLK